MANGKQAAAKRPKMAERARQLQQLHFPYWQQPYVWHRRTSDGFITIPRALPIVMQAIDEQSGKGKPAGHTYFGLWARSPDESMLTIDQPATFAMEAGFKGERAVDTWRKRMKQLRELNLIQTKPGASGDYHYVLLVNPILAVEWMHQQHKIQEGLYARFVERLAEVGAMGEIEDVRVALQTWPPAPPVAPAALVIPNAAVVT